MRTQSTVLVDRLFEGRLVLERRNGSPNLTARTYLNGNVLTKSTGETTEGAARKVATDWFLKELAKVHAGDVPPMPVKGKKAGVLFSAAYDSFIAHAEREKEVTPLQIRNYKHKHSVLKPHLEGVTLPQIDTAWLETLRHKRKKPHPVTKKVISNVTVKKDLMFLRVVLRHAVERDKTLARLPQFPAFRGKVWTAKHQQRPYLPPEMWKKVKKVALQRCSDYIAINDSGANAAAGSRRRRMRQELYAFVMMSVGGALRVEETYSLRWQDCELSKLNGTECVKVWVHGHHTEEGQKRELGWLLYDGVIGWKYLRRVYPNARPADKLFTADHSEGMKDLLKAAGAYVDHETGLTRDAKSLRSTGLSLRLDEGPDPAYNDLSRWARTSPQQLMNFYIQLHPEKAVGRIIGFRDDVPSEMTEKQKKAKQALTKLRKQARNEEMMDNDDVFGVSDDDDRFEEQLSTKSPAALRIVSRKKR